MTIDANTTAAAVSDPSRLAAVGREMGLELTRVPRGPGFAHVILDPTTAAAHYVTALSCDCRRFCRSGSCPHLAFLLDELGWTA